MEAEGALPSSQKLATGLYPVKKTNPVHTLISYFLSIYFNIVIAQSVQS
jgi:hypothetical protein